MPARFMRCLSVRLFILGLAAGVLGEWTIEYDSFHQPTRVKDRAGRVTKSTYDARNLLLTEQYPDHQPGSNPGDAPSA